MNPKAARAILSRCLPESPEASSRSFRKALDVITRSEALRKDYEEQVALDHQARAILTDIVVPPSVAASLSDQAQAMSHRRFSLRDPAMISVCIGFFLLVAVLIWHFMGRAGVFPEDALAIAAEGAKLQNGQFEIVEQPAGSLEDWFLLKGFERFRIPQNFAHYQVAGARIFKFENHPVAILAVPENAMFFIIFDPASYDIHLAQNTWRTAEFDYKFAAAIREEEGMCFMVVIKGKQKDLAPLLSPPKA